MHIEDLEGVNATLSQAMVVYLSRGPLLHSGQAQI